MIAFVWVALFLGCIWALVYLTSGKRNQKSDSRTVRTDRSIEEVANILRQAAQEMRASVDKLEDDPLGKFGVQDDLAVVLYGEERGLSRDMWAVQVYARKNENGCEVELVAMGEGLSAGYTMSVYTGRILLKSSRKRRDLLASRL